MGRAAEQRDEADDAWAYWSRAAYPWCSTDTVGGEVNVSVRLLGLLLMLASPIAGSAAEADPPEDPRVAAAKELIHTIGADREAQQVVDAV